MDYGGHSTGFAHYIMPTGPPCHAMMAPACKQNPNRDSQYKYIPEEKRIELGLPEGACVCKSPLCWRKMGMLGEPGKPGRKPAAKRGREDEVCTPIFGMPAVASRSKPKIIVKILSIKDAR